MDLSEFLERYKEFGYQHSKDKLKKELTTLKFSINELIKTIDFDEEKISQKSNFTKLGKRVENINKLVGEINQTQFLLRELEGLDG